MAGSTEPMTSAGTLVAISVGLPVAPTPTAYAVLNFVDIDQIINVGPIGRTYPPFSYALLSAGTVTQRGNADDGSTTLQMAYVPGDTGQQFLETALDTGAYCSFRVTFKDGTEKYYQARVMGLPTTIGDANTVTGSTANLSIKAGSTITVLPGTIDPIPPLIPLSLSAASFAQTAEPGTIIGTVIGKSVGSTLTLSDDHGGAVVLNGLDLVVGPTPPADQGGFNITFLESLTGAINTPLPTTTTIVVTGPVPPGGFVFIIDSDGAYIVDTDGAYLMEPV